MKNSAIQWTDHTFNPWIGCTKVAPECKNCYAETLMDKRWGRVSWGKGQPRKMTGRSNWRQPEKWNSEAIKEGVRRKVFCASLADVFDEEVSDDWRKALFDTITECKQLDWLLLTKRPKEARRFYRDVIGLQPETIKGSFLPNVWLGVSAGVDPSPLLETPAVIHFLSCEPMLHSMDLRWSVQFDWIIFGGESGAHARSCHVDWIREGVEFCRKYGVAPFVKQLGSNCMGTEMDKWVARIRDSHGGNMDEWPEDLRVREFPNAAVVA